MILAAMALAACAQPAPATAAAPPRPIASTRTEPRSSNEGSRVQFTFSPQPGPASLSPGACGRPDLALLRAAQATLEHYVRTARMPSSETLEFELRSAGAPYVWVRSWAASAPSVEAIEGALAAWSPTSRDDAPLRRCGVATVRRGDSVHSVALVADVLADVSPIPRTARVGQWLPFEAQLHTRATEVALLSLGPFGAPHKLSVQLSPTGVVRARLPLAAPGRWLFQLLPTTAEGPRPVAEVEVFADVPLPPSPSQELVPGDLPECDAACDPDRLVSMLNQARASEKLALLWREPRLALLARQHAEAMRARGQLAHDVGSGDAYIRVSAELPDASLVGENIAHASSLRAAHRALWLSPAHRQNLLRREYGVVGVGVALGDEGDVWVCQLFAAQTAPSATY